MQLVQTLTSFQHCGFCPFVPQTNRLSWNFSMTVMTFWQGPCDTEAVITKSLHKTNYIHFIKKKSSFTNLHIKLISKNINHNFLDTNLFALLLSCCFQSKVLQQKKIFLKKSINHTKYTQNKHLNSPYQLLTKKECWPDPMCCWLLAHVCNIWGQKKFWLQFHGLIMSLSGLSFSCHR